jgi:hypothetical protein
VVHQEIDKVVKGTNSCAIVLNDFAAEAERIDDRNEGRKDQIPSIRSETGVVPLAIAIPLNSVTTKMSPQLVTKFSQVNPLRNHRTESRRLRSRPVTAGLHPAVAGSLSCIYRRSPKGHFRFSFRIRGRVACRFYDQSNRVY